MSNEAKVAKAYKVSPEVKEKLETLFAQSGMETQEGFIEHLAAQYELQQLKVVVPGYKKQLDELDIHARRVNEIFLSMINTEGAERIELVRQFEKKLEERSGVIYLQEQQISEMSKLAKQQEGDLAKALKDNTEISTQLGQAQEISLKGNLLVEEYGKQILSLTGMLDENKAAVDESKGLKAQLTELTNLTDKQVAKILDLAINLQELQESHANQIEQHGIRHKEDLERLLERKDLEKERELLGVRMEYQAKFEKSNEDGTEKIRDLYEQIDKLRETGSKIVKPKSP